MTSPELDQAGMHADVLIGELKGQAQRLGLAWAWQEATVVDGGSGIRPTVLVDGDTVPVPAVSVVGGVADDQRVFVIRIPPSGIYVVGFSADYRLPAPKNSSATGTASTLTNEVYDAVFGDLDTFRGVPGHWYAVHYNPLMNAGTAGHRIIVRVRDGAGATPTTASTLVGEGQLYFAVAGTTGRQRVIVDDAFQSTGGLHTLGVFSLDPDSGAATPLSSRTLYVVDLGLRS